MAARLGRAVPAEVVSSGRLWICISKTEPEGFMDRLHGRIQDFGPEQLANFLSSFPEEKDLAVVFSVYLLISGVVLDEFQDFSRNCLNLIKRFQAL